jgi:predicted DNA-binding protein
MHLKMVLGVIHMGKNAISLVIKEMLSKEETPRAILDKSVRFSISLTNLQNKRLEVLANKVDISKQDFIAKVVEAALIELEDQMGLISSTSIDSLGTKTYNYKAGYIREIVQLLGMTEEQWEKLVDNC